MEKMTKREFLTAVIAIEGIDAELTAFAEAEIEKLDATNAKRKAKVSEKHLENVKIAQRVVDEILGTEPMTATQIGEALGVSTQKASALMRVPEIADSIVKVDIKVKGKGTQKGYTKA